MMSTFTDYCYLAHVLDEAYERLKHVYLNTSVLGPVRLYSARSLPDKELWTFFCALLDFQIPVISILNPMLTGLVSWMEERNIKFIDLIYDEGLVRSVLSNFQWISGRSVRKGFTHRFVKIDDAISLFKVFHQVIEEYNSLGTFVKDVYENSLHLEEPMENTIHSIVRLLSKYGGKPPLVPIGLSSSLKRLNLFMRWMVRPYPDLGLWTFIDKKHLLVSLDEGLCRILQRAFNLKLNENWKSVLKATRFLRKINPEDPVKYDYLLSRISIMGFCAKDHSRSICTLCPLVNICKSSKFIPEQRVAVLRGREHEIFEKFIKVYGHEFDSIKIEYPLGRYSADALLHKINCETYVAEVEKELNYNAIGQVLTYRYLYYKIHGVIVKPIIICTSSTKEIREACEKEHGITIIEIK